jgi:chromosome segregation ATPase
MSNERTLDTPEPPLITELRDALQHDRHVTAEVLSLMEQVLAARDRDIDRLREHHAAELSKLQLWLAEVQQARDRAQGEVSELRDELRQVLSQVDSERAAWQSEREQHAQERRALGSRIASLTQQIAERRRRWWFWWS